MPKASFLKLKITTYQLYQLLIAVLLFVVLAIVTSVIKGNYNPDWQGYYNIFSNGAWLSDEKRDPAFLWLVDLSRALFGNNYLAFRALIRAYFLVYIFLLGLGCMLKPLNHQVNFFAIFFALLSFILIRFTIQIREGLAISVFIMLLSRLYNSKEYTDNGMTNTILNGMLGCLVLLFASMLHGGLYIYLIVFAMAFVFTIIKKYSVNQYNQLYFSLFYLCLLFVGVFPFVFSNFFDPNQLLSTERFDLEEVSKLTAGKIAYWAVYSCLILLLRKKVVSSKHCLNNYELGAVFLDLIAGILMLVLLLFVLVGIFFKLPSSVVTVFIRLLNLNCGILLILLSFNKKDTIFIILFSIFILTDQVRTVIEALINWELI
jgi:hypothetical protein